MNLKISLAFEKNHQPIKTVLESIIPDSSVILEIGSGPGQHAAFFSQHLSQVSKWYPSERSIHLDHIDIWRASLGTQDTLMAPQEADLLAGEWWHNIHPNVFDVIVSINVAHIVRWEGVVALMQGASVLLRTGGIVYFYGPWRYRSKPLEPSNARFDASIQSRIPGSGLRVVETLVEVAQSFGLELVDDVAMPSNNRSIWFQKV